VLAFTPIVYSQTLLISKATTQFSDVFVLINIPSLPVEPLFDYTFNVNGVDCELFPILN
jgi:hypothetical protein